MTASGTGPYRTSHLPPMPNRETGVPRPPHAPLWPSWQPGESEDDPKYTPAPPPAQAPVLEFFKDSHRMALETGAFGVAFSVVAMTLIWRGFEWTTVWPMWLVVLSPVPLFLLFRKVDIIAAGADWLLWKKKWVKTYDLAKVKLSPRGAQFNLILTDREGRKLSIPWLQLCYNRALWDLVYNGILHSAHNGPFTSNREARSTLQLPR